MIDFTNETLALETKDMGGEITREIIRLKERAVREGLIALGWTPPEMSDSSLIKRINNLTDQLLTLQSALHYSIQSLKIGIYGMDLLAPCLPENEIENHREGMKLMQMTLLNLQSLEQTSPKCSKLEKDDTRGRSLPGHME